MKEDFEDLVAYLEHWAGRRAEGSLFTFLDSQGQTVDHYTFRRFHERSNYVAAHLAATGVVRYNEPVLLVYEPGLEILVAFFACIKLGALPVPVPPLSATGFSGSLRKLSLIATDAGATAVLASKRCLDQMRSFSDDSRTDQLQSADTFVSSLDWIRTDEFQGESSDFSSHINPIMFLQYTSGSTENPRGVVVSHQNVIHNALASCSQAGCDVLSDDPKVAVTWLPHYHDMGLIGYYLTMILAGGHLLAFSDFSFMRRPLLWLEAISKYGAQASSAPNFAYEYMLREDVVSDEALATLNLHSVKCLMNGSEPVSSATMARFADRFASCGLDRDAVTAVYGLAEATLAVSHGGRQHLAVSTQRLQQGQLKIESGYSQPVPSDSGSNGKAKPTWLASCGEPVEGMEVRIVDPHTQQPLDEDSIGEIWLRGASKAMGYWNKPELTKRSFEATLGGGVASQLNGSAVSQLAATASEQELAPVDRGNLATEIDPPQNKRVGYLRTGDLGFFHDGELFICGRLKDVIIFRGKNYFPHDIESIAQAQIPTCRPGSIAAFAIEREDGEDALAVIAECKRQHGLPDAEKVCEAIRKQARLEVAVFAAVKPGSIARTSSGKIARYECRRRWLADEMNVLASHYPAESDSTERVLQDVLECIQMPGMEDLNLAEAGVDSLALVSLSLFIKQYQQSQGIYDSDEFSDLKILQTIRVGELKEMITAFQADQLPEGVREICSAKLKSIQTRESQLMRQDSQLATDIVPQATDFSGPNGKVVLTGSTGFFGRFMLDSLLRLSDSKVAVVVRSQDVHHAQRRIEAALQRVAPRDAEAADALRHRVSVHCGDLQKTHLGLSDDCWNSMAEEASAIYHCGAAVDYVRPYEALRTANVQGTEEALRLACEGRAKSFHLVSTTFIFGWSAPRSLLESDFNPRMEELDFGYAQTKWVAEQLVFAAAKRGLNACVYRPSLLTASLGGHYVQRDITVRILAYMIKYQISVSIENQLSLLPACIAADNLIALSQLEAPPATTYHITADDYYSLPIVTDVISRNFGYSFEYIDADSFIEHVNRHCTRDDLLYPLIPFINSNFKKLDHMRHKRYDNRQYRLGRENSPHSCPEPPLSKTVGAIVEYLQREQLISQPAVV